MQNFSSQKAEIYHNCHCFAISICVQNSFAHIHTKSNLYMVEDWDVVIYMM